MCSRITFLKIAFFVVICVHSSLFFKRALSAVRQHFRKKDHFLLGFGGFAPSPARWTPAPWPPPRGPHVGSRPTPPECMWEVRDSGVAAGGWSHSSFFPGRGQCAFTRPRTRPASISRGAAARRRRQPRWVPTAAPCGRGSAAPWGCSPCRCKATHELTCAPSCRGCWSTTSSGSRGSQPGRMRGSLHAIRRPPSPTARTTAVPRRPPPCVYRPVAGTRLPLAAAAAALGSPPADAGAPLVEPPPAAAIGQ